jgi:hypothetical protein
VHIPRTGGGSVTSAISRAYGRAKSAGNVQLSADKTHRLLEHVSGNLDSWSGRAFADHVPYGLFARYLPPDTQYITFLRDPVERVLSHYYFHAQAGPEKVRMIWRRELAAAGDGGTVGDEDDDTLEAGHARGITSYNNCATRVSWGGETLEGELPPDAVEQAKDNLASFAFVGVTERLDEAVILLGKLLGVPLAGYHLRHVREGRPKAAEVPADLIRLIEQHNALDIELYRVARERFDAEAAAAGDVSAEVEKLREQRAEVTEEAEARRIERKTAGKARRRAAKLDRGGRRQTEDVPTGDAGDDELRGELAELKQRMQTIEAALTTGGSQRPAADAGDARSAGSGSKAERRGLVPWRRERRRRQQAGVSAQTEPEPIGPPSDGEPAQETPGPVPADPAAGQQEQRAARRDRGGGADRARKPRKQASADGTGEGGTGRRDEKRAARLAGVERPKKNRRVSRNGASGDEAGADAPDPEADESAWSGRGAVSRATS